MKVDWKKYFTDGNGRMVVWQRPNWPLVAAGGLYLLRCVDGGLIERVSETGFVWAILYWSYLEIFFGVNLWRRLLGLGVSGFMLLDMLLKASS